MYLHKEPSADEKVLAAVAVAGDVLMPAKLALPLDVEHTVNNARHPVGPAYRALPVLFGYLVEGRVDALQVVHGRARLATQQVAQLVADPAVVIVVHRN